MTTKEEQLSPAQALGIIGTAIGQPHAYSIHETPDPVISALPKYLRNDVVLMKEVPGLKQGEYVYHVRVQFEPVSDEQPDRFVLRCRTKMSSYESDPLDDFITTQSIAKLAEVGLSIMSGLRVLPDWSREEVEADLEKWQKDSQAYMEAQQKHNDWIEGLAIQQQAQGMES